jgi:hypothetical protein
MHITTNINNTISNVTAKQCDLNSKYIYGKGFDFATDIVDKNNTIIKKGVEY